MKRVVIPIVDDSLSEYFGQCNHYKIFDISDSKVISEKIEVPSVPGIEFLPEWAAEKGVTDIIAYKVDRSIISMFALQKIHLYVGVRKTSPQDLIREFLDGHLQSDRKIIKEILEPGESN
jgi:predicted Fe-Mo cluster-binding NifX family protein